MLRIGLPLRTSFAAGGPLRVEETVELGQRDDLTESAEAVLPELRPVDVESRGDHDDPRRDFDFTRLFRQVDPLGTYRLHALPALRAGLPVDGWVGGIASRVRAIDGLALGQLEIELVQRLFGAGIDRRLDVGHIGSDPPWVEPYCGAEIPDETCGLDQLRIRVDGDLGVVDHRIHHRAQQIPRLPAGREKA